MSKKYELTDNTIEHNGVTLHRIKALIDIVDENNPEHEVVHAGDLGGFVESEENLSHEGLCWIYDYSKVYGNAKLQGNSVMFHYAELFDNAIVDGSVKLVEYAKVHGSVNLYGCVETDCSYAVKTVFKEGEMKTEPVQYRICVKGYADISDNAEISGCVEICDYVKLRENANVKGCVGKYSTLNTLEDRSDLVVINTKDEILKIGGYEDIGGDTKYMNINE